MAWSERERRWRLVLGSAANALGLGRGTGEGEEGSGISATLSEADKGMDKTLEALYDTDRRGNLGSSSPNVSRWLGDIRTYFPASVVKIMQQDALDRLNLTQMLLQPELLEQVEPDVHLVANLIALGHLIPNETKDTARMVVGKVVDELQRKLYNPTRQAILGSLSRATRNYRPRHNEIDWNRTIRANLRHYQPDYRTIIPETLIGFGRRRSSLRDIVLCVDQSGSMAASVVYSSIFAAVMASLPAVSTRLVVFDTAVVDLTEKLQDPVEVLFGTQLGGGTDINRALAYAQSLIRQPQDTILVLISDLYEGGVEAELLKRSAAIVASGIQVIVLLALCDTGAAGFDQQMANKLATMGIPAFACTPDQFPGLMAAAINRQDIAHWATTQDIVTAAPGRGRV